MTKSIGAVGLARVVAGAAALVTLGASMIGCSGSGPNIPSTAQSSATTITAQAPPPDAAPHFTPTEKNIAPVCGKLFTPTVPAPAASAAMPGVSDNTG